MQLLCFSQPSAEDSALQFSIFWCEMKVENRIQSIKTQTDAGSYETLTHTHAHARTRAHTKSMLAKTDARNSLPHTRAYKKREHFGSKRYDGVKTNKYRNIVTTKWPENDRKQTDAISI